MVIEEINYLFVFVDLLYHVLFLDNLIELMPSIPNKNDLDSFGTGGKGKFSSVTYFHISGSVLDPTRIVSGFCWGSCRHGFVNLVRTHEEEKYKISCFAKI
jgi:hypothetical protein